MSSVVEELVLLGTNFQPQRRLSGRAPPGDSKRHGDVLKKLTHGLVETYGRCSNNFGYSLQQAPRRVLTKLSKGVHNNGHDNADHDYICKVGDKIANPDGQTYEIFERLGHGTFGQVLKCTDSSGSSPIALKIIKNKPPYFHQALMEVRILQMLNSEFDPEDENRLVRMLDFFVYRKHLCIVFELLSVNLYDVLKQNSFRGVSMALVKVLTEQLLKAMRCLREARVIHCDLKPENVLLSNMQHTRIKLIDFGSACFENHTVYSYIQSRFYRSPEVLLGLPYTSAIDMWSLGCICAELFLGLPIFPGQSEYDQVCRIVEVLGLPPANMLDIGTNTRRYFKRMEELPADAAGKGASVSGDTASDAPRGRVPRQSHLSSKGEESDDEPEPSERDSMTSPTGRQGVDRPPTEPEGDVSSHEGEVATAADAEGDDAAVEPPPEVTVANAESVEAETQESTAAPRKENMRRTDLFFDLIKRQFGMTSDEPPTATDEQEEQEGGMSETAHPPANSDDTATSVDGRTSLDNGQGTSSAVSPAAEFCAKQAASGDETAPPDSSADVGSSRANASASTCSSIDGGQVPLAAQPAGAGIGHGHHSVRRGRARKRGSRTVWRLKAMEEYERDEHKKEPVPKNYFNFKSLKRMVELVPVKSNLTPSCVIEEEERRVVFLQFLEGVLQINPDTRWTPTQASGHPFITGARYDPDFQPIEDEPVPSSTKDLSARRPHRGSLPTIFSALPSPEAAHGEVPRLPAEAMGQLNTGSQASAGGGSARTYNEDVSRQATAGGSDSAEQPRSAPATSRAPLRSLAPPAAASSSSTGGAAPPFSAAVGSSRNSDTDTASISLPNWHLSPGAQGIQLPDDNPNESYRPPIEKIPGDYIRNAARAQMQMQMQNCDQLGGRSTASPPKASGAWSVSTGASFCSSSSTGSTPTGGRGRHGQASPYAMGSPLSAGGYPSKGQHQPHMTLAQDAKLGGHAIGRHQLSGTTTTPASSSYGSSGSTALNMNMGGVMAGGRTGVQTPHRHGASSGGSGVATHRRGEGSQHGSRGSSPWHLPSPMSTLSAASDRLNSSQPSGSDSCGVDYDGAHCDFDECTFEDPSQSDTPRWRFDSDCATPGSHEATGQRAEEGVKDPQHARWESIESGIARVQLSRDRLHRRMDIAQSPGSAGEPGNFRERVGMTESGPVIPFGHGPRGRDAISSMMTPHQQDGAWVQESSATQHSYHGHRSPYNGGSGGHHGHGHGRHRNRKPR